MAGPGGYNPHAVVIELGDAAVSVLRLAVDRCERVVVGLAGKGDAANHRMVTDALTVDARECEDRLVEVREDRAMDLSLLRQVVRRRAAVRHDRPVALLARRKRDVRAARTLVGLCVCLFVRCRDRR